MCYGHASDCVCPVAISGEEMKSYYDYDFTEVVSTNARRKSSCQRCKPWGGAGYIISGKTEKQTLQVEGKTLQFIYSASMKEEVLESEESEQNG
jgi:hypothetical protein